MGFVAGIFQVFPFAGSRHQTYLLPFFVSGISAALVWLQPRLAALLFLIGVIVIAPIWVTYSAPDNNGRILAKGDMTAAIEFVDRTVPRGAPLFADYETLYVLKYYLARDDTNQGALRSEKEERLGGYRIVTPREWVWAFRPNEVLDQVNESAQAIGVRPGDPLWVISAAWTEPSLASRLASGQNRESREFGRISVIKIITWNQSQITLEPITPK
jgi:hypothetical protein